MKRERIQKKTVRPREQAPEVPPLSAREVFYPYPIRRESEPPSQRSR
jgi:hypothetical protein